MIKSDEMVAKLRVRCGIKGANNTVKDSELLAIISSELQITLASEMIRSGGKYYETRFTFTNPNPKIPRNASANSIVGIRNNETELVNGRDYSVSSNYISVSRKYAGNRLTLIYNRRPPKLVLEADATKITDIIEDEAILDKDIGNRVDIIDFDGIWVGEYQANDSKIETDSKLSLGFLASKPGTSPILDAPVEAEHVLIELAIPAVYQILGDTAMMRQASIKAKELYRDYKYLSKPRVTEESNFFEKPRW